MTRVAAIDCGTNSIRLLVADLGGGPTGPLTDVVRRMRVVRLGQGVDRTGRLADEAVERTRVALVDYAAEMGDLDVERVRMVATSATRDASNREVFRWMVLDTLGAEPEVVSGDEEARLSFAGAVLALDTVPPPYLVADIGGGSTELVLGTGAPDDAAGNRRGMPTVLAARSVDVGCVRMTERHLHDDPPTPAQVAAAEADVRAALADAARTVPVEQARTLVGVAGSVTTVVALALGLQRYDPDAIHGAGASYEQVADIARMLLTVTRETRAALPVMHPGRVDVIGAGALVLRVLMEETGAPAVVASEHDILDGIARSIA